MNYFSYTKNLLALALVGCCSFGLIFGFWWKGEDLEMFRAIGAILFVLIGATFFRNIILEKKVTPSY